MSVRLSCPRALHHGCRGALTIDKLAGVRKRAAVIGRSRYGEVAPGSAGRFRVTIRPATAAAARRHGHINVRVEAREHDAKGMPKLSLKTMKLKG